MAVLLVRTVHGLITAFFLTCLGYVYYAGVTNTAGLWSTLAVAALIGEGLVLVVNKGDCPLGSVHRRYGDDRTFFELFLPKAVAKQAIPVLFVITVGGFLLLMF